jgi:hypothetical protein
MEKAKGAKNATRNNFGHAQHARSSRTRDKNLSAGGFGLFGPLALDLEQALLRRRRQT